MESSQCPDSNLCFPHRHCAAWWPSAGPTPYNLNGGHGAAITLDDRWASAAPSIRPNGERTRGHSTLSSNPVAPTLCPQPPPPRHSPLVLRSDSRVLADMRRAIKLAFNSYSPRPLLRGAVLRLIYDNALHSTTIKQLQQVTAGGCRLENVTLRKQRREIIDPVKPSSLWTTLISTERLTSII